VFVLVSCLSIWFSTCWLQAWMMSSGNLWRNFWATYCRNLFLGCV
jgi:hypothetical protein